MTSNKQIMRKEEIEKVCILSKAPDLKCYFLAVGKRKIIQVLTSGFEAGKCQANTEMASGLVKLI